MNWLGLEPGADPLGTALLAVGVDMTMLKEWTVDPQEALGEIRYLLSTIYSKE